MIELLSMCDFSDNNDTRLRRGRSCSKYISGAEIHSAEIEAMEETGFASPPSQRSTLIFMLLGI